MILPILEGIIARRILLNFRVDPKVARRAVPKPLEIVMQNGFAIVGVCLIRLEQLRPKRLPTAIGISSENMAHRIAIRYPKDKEMQDGVFIWRRETDQEFITLLGGRLFPGVHGKARFKVVEDHQVLKMDVSTEKNEADISLDAEKMGHWQATPTFKSFDEVSQFFVKGDCGFSCSLRKKKLEGIRLKTLKWEMTPLQVTRVYAAFYQKNDLFPKGSIEFDCACFMHHIPHEWHELSDVPELAGITVNEKGKDL